MPYILTKTNGNTLTVVDDASLDVSTDLTFVGRNYSGYGEAVNENFLKLLENFSNDAAPPNPISGQLWFDSSSGAKKLNVYDGKQFKTVANVHVSDTKPSFPTNGDLWWDSVNSQLNAYDSAYSVFRIIGPSGSSRASWEIGEETVTGSMPAAIIKGKIGSNTIAVLSNKTFVPNAESTLNGIFPKILTGLTLAGANAVTGSTTSTGYYLWGTAAESMSAMTATTVMVKYSAVNQAYFVPFGNQSDGASVLSTNNGIKFNPSTGILSTIASSAQYADLAERYETDSAYDVGTVVIIGGEKEITVAHKHGDTAVAGIISNNPAYQMNADAGNDETHPYVALRGRVPCKVIGPVKKGALLVTSAYPGYAEVMKPNDSPNAVLGKALQDFDGVKGLVEVLV